MYTTHTAENFSRPDADASLESRLSWLLWENEQAENQARLWPDPRKHEELLLMRRPVAAQQAYARFGLLLGTFPPAAIFVKLFGRALADPDSIIIALFLIVIAFCALAGLYLGSKLSRLASAAEDSHWLVTLIGAPCLGLLWGLTTGAAGGLPGFVLGALCGAVCAAPVGALGFALFMPLHRLLARGGMIDARHFWPLACGVVAVVTAIILGL